MIFILSSFDKVRSSNFSTYFAIFHLWWPFWIRDYLFWKADDNSVSLINNLPYFIKIKNLTYLSDFWLRVTSGDLATIFPYLTKNLKIDPKWPEIRNLRPDPKLLSYFFLYHWSFLAIISLNWTYLWFLIKNFKKGVGVT